MFSNPASFANFQKAPIWLDEARLLAGLNGTQFQFNYEFMRAEALASSGQLPNMLQESSLDVPMGVHVYYKNATEDPTPHVAAFMLLRSEYWYFFGSTGWVDSDWKWSPIYDKVGKCGKPLGRAVGSPAPTIYTRAYEGCKVRLDCTDPKNCEATIEMS